MRWSQLDIHKQLTGELRKDLDGFFVGPSLELQVAFGTVAFYESVAGRYLGPNTGVKYDRKAVAWMNGHFHLMMDRNTTLDHERFNVTIAHLPKITKIAHGMNGGSAHGL